MDKSGKIDWKAEQDRFMAAAYDRCERAARRAFKKWPRRKRDDAIQEAMGKMWYQWRCCLEKDKEPAEIIGPLIHWAIMFVRYDRRIARRSGGIDVYDYRAGMRRQQLSGQGKASPTDRSDPGNTWLDWALDAGEDDPADLVAALEAVGLTSDDWAA
jgi:hypothetical protein